MLVAVNLKTFVMTTNSTENIKDKVIKIVSEQLGVAGDQINEQSRFIEDLGADSLDVVEIVMHYEEQFGIRIPDEVAEKMKTIGDVIAYIEKNI
jgi:acyl carrier protein